MFRKHIPHSKVKRLNQGKQVNLAADEAEASSGLSESPSAAEPLSSAITQHALQENALVATIQAGKYTVSTLSRLHIIRPGTLSELDPRLEFFLLKWLRRDRTDWRPGARRVCVTGESEGM